MISAHPNYDTAPFSGPEFDALLMECQCYEQAAYLRCKQLAEETGASYWQQMAQAFAPPAQAEIDAIQEKKEEILRDYHRKYSSGELRLWQIPEPWRSMIASVYYPIPEGRGNKCQS